MPTRKSLVWRLADLPGRRPSAAVGSVSESLAGLTSSAVLTEAELVVSSPSCRSTATTRVIAGPSAPAPIEAARVQVTTWPSGAAGPAAAGGVDEAELGRQRVGHRRGPDRRRACRRCEPRACRSPWPPIGKPPTWLLSIVRSVAVIAVASVSESLPGWGRRHRPVPAVATVAVLSPTAAREASRSRSIAISSALRSLAPRGVVLGAGHRPAGDRQVQPLPEAAVGVSPAGSVSVTVVVPAVARPPRFWTAIV